MSMFVIAVAILVPLGLAMLFPKQAEAVFTGMMMFKRYVIGAASLIFAALFLMTGDFFLMLLGALIFAYAIWFLLFNTDVEVEASA